MAMDNRADVEHESAPYRADAAAVSERQQREWPQLYGSLQPVWRDVGAAVLFLLHLAGSLSFTVYCIVRVRNEYPRLLDRIVSRVGAGYALLQVGLALGTSILGTVGLLVLARRSAVIVIKGAYLLTITILVIKCLYYAVRLVWMGAVAAGVFAVLIILLYILARPKIPLSAAILEMVMDCTRVYRSLLWVGYLAGILSVTYFLFVAVGAVALVQLVFDVKDMSSYWLLFFFLSVFWTQQVFSNGVHAIIAGVVGTNYFTGGRKVVFATGRFLGRILTYNFGSICLGSIGVLLIQMTESIARRHSEHDMIGRLILYGPLRLLRNLMNYFNKYAFVEVALYGKPYFCASRETRKMLKRRGLDSVVNDLLIGQVTFLLPLFLGLTAATLSVLVSHHVYHKDVFTSVPAALLAFLIVLLFPLMAFRVIDSGSTATFVCLAEDPARLERHRPDIYEILVSWFDVLDESASATV